MVATLKSQCFGNNQVIRTSRLEIGANAERLHDAEHKFVSCNLTVQFLLVSTESPLLFCLVNREQHDNAHRRNQTTDLLATDYSYGTPTRPGLSHQRFVCVSDDGSRHGYNSQQLHGLSFQQDRRNKRNAADFQKQNALFAFLSWVAFIPCLPCAAWTTILFPRTPLAKIRSALSALRGRINLFPFFSSDFHGQILEAL